MASEWPWLTPFPQKVYVFPLGMKHSAINLFKEKIPGSQPHDINDVFLPSNEAVLTFLKCSWIFAWVSKLSITLNIFAYFGVWIGKSVAEPPQIIKTSILSCHFSISATDKTIFLFKELIVLGSLLVKIATNSISVLYFITCSMPFPKFPYPNIPIFIFILSPTYNLSQAYQYHFL